MADDDKRNSRSEDFGFVMFSSLVAVALGGCLWLFAEIFFSALPILLPLCTDETTPYRNLAAGSLLALALAVSVALGTVVVISIALAVGLRITRRWMPEHQSAHIAAKVESTRLFWVASIFSRVYGNRRR